MWIRYAMRCLECMRCIEWTSNFGLEASIRKERIGKGDLEGWCNTVRGAAL